MLFLLFWAILCSTGGDGLHSSESIEIEKRSVFLFLLPRSRLAGPCFRSVGLSSSWLEWGASTCGGFQGVSRSRSCLLRPVGPPRFKSLGCRATWSPWLLVSRAIASVTFRLRAATATTPVHHSLCWRIVRVPQNLCLNPLPGVRSMLLIFGIAVWMLLQATPLTRSMESSPKPGQGLFLSAFKGCSSALNAFSF